MAIPAEALAGFASREWLFVLAVHGLAAATARLGLLYRFVLLLVRILGPTLAMPSWRLLGILRGPERAQPPSPGGREGRWPLPSGCPGCPSSP